MAQGENFVKLVENEMDSPILGDWKTLRDLRKFCYSKEELADSSFKLKALWVLVRYEYAALIEASNDSERKAASWMVQRACNEFCTFSQEKGFANQETWAMKILLAQNYQDVAREYLPPSVDEKSSRGVVAKRLMEIFSPASTHPVNRNILTAMRNPVVKAQEALSTAIIARVQAAASLRNVYGIKPEETQTKLRDSLSKEESDAFFSNLDSILAAMKILSTPFIPSDSTLIDRYVALKEHLDLKGKPIPEDLKLEEFFGNEARKENLQKVWVWFKEFGIFLPDDLKELRNWINKRTELKVLAKESEKKVVEQMESLMQDFAIPVDFSIPEIKLQEPIQRLKDLGESLAKQYGKDFWLQLYKAIQEGEEK